MEQKCSKQIKRKREIILESGEAFDEENISQVSSFLWDIAIVIPDIKFRILTFERFIVRYLNKNMNFKGAPWRH